MDPARGALRPSGSTAAHELTASVHDFWDEIAELVEDAYRMVAPRTLLTQLDAQRARPAVSD